MSDLFKNSLLFSAMMLLPGAAISVEAHVHGAGQLYIAQQQQDWVIRFDVPAINLLGYEHAPQTDEQKQQFRQLQRTLTLAANALTLSADCAAGISSVEIESEEPGTDDDAEAQHHHSDIELEYQFHCESAPTHLQVTLFKQAPSLQHLQAQWITEQGQGMLPLSPDQTVVSWQ